jgi:hypothetical protein
MEGQRLEHAPALVEGHAAQRRVAHAAAISQNLGKVEAFGISQRNDFAGAGVEQLVRVGGASGPAAKGVVFEGGRHGVGWIENVKFPFVMLSILRIKQRRSGVEASL